MSSYLVILSSDSGIDGNTVRRLFSDKFYEINSRVWAISGPYSTAEEVCSLFEAEVGVDAFQGLVVVRIDDYYGIYDKSLWNRLWQWNRAGAE